MKYKVCIYKRHFILTVSLCFTITFLSCQTPSSDQQNREPQNSATQVSQENSTPALKPGHIVMQVSDLDRSQKFYEDHLHLKTTERLVFEGSERLFMSASESHHELVLLEPRKEEFLPIEMRQLQQVAFEVSSHKELVNYYQEIKAADIPYTIKDNQVSLSLYFPDPDDVTIELYWDTQDEPFGESMWRGRHQDITEEEFLNPYEYLTRD